MAGPGADAADEAEVVQFFHALADRTRLAIVRSLAESDLRAGEIVALVALPQNAVSYHLRQLRGIGLLRDRRSSADGRDVYYSIDQERLQALYQRAGAVLRPLGPPRHRATGPARIGEPLRLLFLCTHNSARSQLAEGIARQIGRAGVVVASAGDTPTALHPLTAELLAEWAIDPALHTSKPLEAFSGHTFDYVITVCDRVREQCPTFPGSPRQLHWSIPDPIAAPVAERRAAFLAVRHEIAVRVRHLLRERAVLHVA